MKNQLVIRLHRVGRIKRPFYFIVVTKKYKSAQGAFIAKIGYYDPFALSKIQFNNLVIYNKLLTYWLARGAKPNERLQKLLYL